jgi:branched-chain amino acid transport system ATP-binding protein
VLPVLETRRLSVAFGGLVAVDNVSLQVRPGEFKSVIGPNGAGKTTFFNLISGVYRPVAGQVLFKGREITGLPPYEISRLGIGRSFQITNLFPNLTTLENVRLAVQSRANVGARFLSHFSAYRRFLERAEEVLAATGLSGREQVVANALAHGDKRKLEIAMLLAADPEVLLLDEPTAGMSHDEVPGILEVIAGIKRAGKTILLVEHKIDVVMSLSDSIAVLNRGALIADGPPAAVAADAAVQQAYLGGAT